MKKFINKLLYNLLIKRLGKLACIYKSNELRTYYIPGPKRFAQFNPVLTVSLVLAKYFEDTPLYMRPVFTFIGVVEDLDYYEITISTTSPGKLIGTAGSTHDTITNQLKSIFKKDVQLRIKESSGLVGLSYKDDYEF